MFNKQSEIEAIVEDLIEKQLSNLLQTILLQSENV